MRKAIFLLLAVLAVFSCREPRSTEQFVPGEGPFVFSVDLSDTTAVYDVDLYSRLMGFSLRLGVPGDFLDAAVAGSLYAVQGRSPCL